MATINGTSFADNLVGTSGADTINARAGDDVVRGGGGRDTITLGSGRDTVVYLAPGDSPFASNWDLITDFARGDDRIDLTALLGATNLFWGGITPTANGVWYTVSGTTISVFADTNGAPATPEMRIDLQNMAAGTVLSASDFLGVSAANAAPVFTSSANFTMPENSGLTGTVTATDPDGQFVTYTLLPGGDAALFGINASTGVLGPLNAFNFEAPADIGANNVYNLTVRASDGTLSTTQAISITVTNVNDVAPAFTSPAAYSIAENSTAVGTVTATDADSPTVTYSLVAGGDAASFSINATTGALSFVTAPNFEAPTDIGANNVYNVTVQASDGALNTTQAVAVTVTDVAETPTGAAPVFTSPASYSVAENSTPVGTVAATDADSPTVTYSLVTGGDAASFSINATTGALSFVTAPNFEAPTDAGANNVYNLTVQASDGALNTTQAIAVTVTDVVNEILTGNAAANTLVGAGGNDIITGNAGADILTGNGGADTFVFASTTDSPANTNWQTPPDGTVTRVWDAITDFTQGTDKIDLSAYMGATDLGWANGVPTGNAVWYVNSGTSTFIYVDVDNNPPPDVMIELQNRGSLTLTANDFIGVVGGATGTGAAPVFTSPAAYTVPENGTAVGTVTATDADSPTVTYSLVAGGDAARFAINTTTGALSFVAAPNFEAPTDVGANNVYNLTVQASDGTLNTTQAIAVTVTNVNDVAPAFTSPAAYSIAENSTAVGTVAATDADSPTVTYSLVAGGDAASFTINATTGALSFVTAPNFEAPTDVGANNVYNVTVQASDGTLNTTQAVAVTVTDVVNEAGAAPVFTSPAAYSVPENGTAVGIVTATDADSPTVTYSLVAGGDAASFSINATTGALSFVTAPNFEAPTDIGANNVYNVTVQASDGTLNTTQAVAVTVTDVAETPTGAAPVFTSPAAYSVPENGTAVGTVTATDADSPTVTYSLVTGGDAASFTINATTGALSFVTAPNFEAPTDVGTNNVYNLTVQASDGALNTTQAIAVTVTDVVNEILTGNAAANTLVGAGGNDIITGNAGADTLTGNGGADTFVFASTTDSPANTNWQTPPDGTVTRVWDAITDFTQGTDKIDLSAYMGATDLGWANGVPTGNAVWYVNSGTSTFIYVDVDNNPPPDVMIELQNRGSLTLTANDFIGVVGGATGTGAAPVFTSPATYTVPENGTAVGTVTATDADSPTVTYSLVAGGDAARFAINTTTGALSFVAAPNFEAPTDVGANNVYNLTVQASDGTLNTTQAIAVTVTNVNDVAPAFTSPAAYSIAENSTAVGTVAATDADSPTVTYSLVAGGDAASFTINATTGALSFVTAPNFEAPTDVGANNVYNLTVRASDGTLNTTQAVAVTVTDVVNEAGAAPVFTSPAAYSVPENGTAVGTVTATDADSPTVTYSLVAGGDAARFAINTTTGALSFVAAPNFEAPTDVGANNVYNLTVQASDGTLNTTQAIAVTVTNVNDVAPAFTSPAAYSIAENGTAVGTVAATDADSPTVTYSLIAGGDAASFTINATTGALSFVTAPNFEAPTDVGANNVYNLSVQASDGSLNTTQAIAVTVTDVVVEPIAGTAGNDTLTGTAGDDIFDIGAGGNDTVTAGTGNDTVQAGAAFNALDRIDGGTEPSDAVETDVLVLNGNYAAGVTFAATTLINVEEIQLVAGNSYSLTTHDATVVASTMAIDGSALGVGNTLTVNASAETEAGSSYSMYGGAGNDSLTGGAGDDYFDISFGGNDIVNGGAGRDTIYAGAALTAADQVNGGAGTDFIYLSGNYSAGLTFGATTLTGIEAIVVQPGNSYNLTMNNAMLTGTQAATVDGFALASGNTLTVNASAETDAGTVYTLSGGAGNDNLTGGAGNDQLNGNAGNDILVGGAGNDILTGGAGNDILTGGLGNDVFDFNTLTDRGTTGDTITDFSKSGANGVDVLNLHDLLTTFTGFNGTNAFSGGYLQFDTSSGTSTTVRVDSNGGANSFVTLVTMNGTLLLQTDTTNYVL